MKNRRRESKILTRITPLAKEYRSVPPAYCRALDFPKPCGFHMALYLPVNSRAEMKRALSAKYLPEDHRTRFSVVCVSSRKHGHAWLRFKREHSILYLLWIDTHREIDLWTFDVRIRCALLGGEILCWAVATLALSNAIGKFIGNT